MNVQHIGSYRVGREIGRGGMGAVYEALHETIGQQAAVKVLHREYATDPEVVRRFLNEARAVSMVQHPGLVKIFDFGKLPDDTVYILMEHLVGEPLHQRLRRLGGRLPQPEALRITRQIASALDAAHGKGIVHRDLKPANVMIVPDPEAQGRERAKVLDFGVAKIRPVGDSPAMDPALRTTTGLILGTPMYMSPEQCRGAGGVDEKADVYSLGVMLYQMLAGRPPFDGRSPGDLIVMHLTQQPQPLREFVPSLPQGAEALVHGMLAKEPAARPVMGQVVLALEQMSAERSLLFSAETRAVAQIPVASPTPPSTLGRATGQTQSVPGQNATRTALLLAALLIGVIGTVVWISGRPRPASLPPPPMKAASSPSDHALPSPPPPEAPVDRSTGSVTEVRRTPQPVRERRRNAKAEGRPGDRGQERLKDPVNTVNTPPASVPKDEKIPIRVPDFH